MVGTTYRPGLHRNDHGHRFHTCHHERCQADPIARHLLRKLSTAAWTSREQPRPLTIAQARVA